MQTSQGNQPFDPNGAVTNLMSMLPQGNLVISQEQYAAQQGLPIKTVANQVRNRTLPSVALSPINSSGKKSTRYINLLGIFLQCLDEAGYELAGISKKRG